MGVLDRGEQGDGNETGLKEGGEIEMSTTVLPLRDARSLRLNTHQCSFRNQLPHHLGEFSNVVGIHKTKMKKNSVRSKGSEER